MRSLAICSVPLVLIVIASACAPDSPGGAESSTSRLVKNAPISVQNGETQPVFSYPDAIRETVFVEAPSDGDGVKDRVAVDVVRPKTDPGAQVSIVMEASPYYGIGATKASSTTLHVPGAPVPLGFRHWYDEYLVTRGYAAVEVEMQGTSRSTGCPTTGGKEDTASIVAAIDWLNGRARGFHQDGTETVATWSNGGVGMVGVSYNGTLPIAVATAGTPGLKTIIPIGAISSWYDYARDTGIGYTGWEDRYPQYLANFVVSANQADRCASVLKALGDDAGDDTFDYTPFWAERDYRQNMDQVTASVFIVHGLHDENVKKHNFARFWYGIAQRNVPRKIWLHNQGHIDPVSERPDVWKKTMHHWMDYWLYGVDNGIMNEPMATIERPDGTWDDRAGWPEPGTRDRTFYPTQAGALAGDPLTAPTEGAFTDDTTQSEIAAVTDPTTPQAFRLAWVTDALAAPVRVSGTPRVHAVVKAATASTPLSAILMDYGTASVAEPRNLTIAELLNQSCTLGDVEHRTGCAAPQTADPKAQPFQILTHGAVDVKNHASIAQSAPLVPGESYVVDWDLQPIDHVFAAGHKIGLVLLANDKNYAAADPLAGGVSVKLDKTSFTLPVAP